MSISYIDDSQLKVKKLTKKEKLWLERLEKVLAVAPNRLSLCTQGDADLLVVDNSIGSELCDNAALEDGVLLARVPSSAIIHGVSG